MADFAFFQIDVSENNRTVTLRRITDTHHTSSLFSSAAYLDAEKLETAYKASVTANDNKVFRFPIPGAEALAVAGVDLGDNMHTYIVNY